MCRAARARDDDFEAAILGRFRVFEEQVGRAMCRNYERNCVSNIRPEGLPLEIGAQKVDYLLGEMAARRLSGVGLKDESSALSRL